MIRITVALDELTWRRLRDIAEEKRIRGRTNISALILAAIRAWLNELNTEVSAREGGR